MNVRVNDLEWKILSKNLSKLPQRAAHSRGRPRTEDRALFEGILWVLVTGCRWRDLPKKEYPAKSSCFRRFAHWCQDGSWQKVQRTLIQILGRNHQIESDDGFIDGTKIKAKKGALRLAFQEPINLEAKRAA